MIQNNELVSLILATGVLIFIWVYYRRLRRIPRFRFLLAGFCCMHLGLVLTVLEGFFWETLLNTVEHVSNVCSYIFLVIWIWFMFRPESENLWRS